MPRTRPPGRLAALAEAAAATFVTHGYARAQVEDVADELGVAKGTVYGYVSSKETLFALAVAYGDRPQDLPADLELPLDLGDLPGPAQVVAERLAGEVEGMRLVAAARAPGADAADEVEQIARDLLVRLGRHRVVIKLVDTCARDFPELAELWFGGGRWAQVDLLSGYLEEQADAGRLHLPGEAPLVARTIIELCAMWAVHMHWDPAPRPLDPDAVLASVPRMVRRLVAGGQTRKEST